MNRLPDMQPQGQSGPIAKLLTSLLLIAIGAIALFFGAIIIAVLIGFAAILFLALYLRTLWLRHKLGMNVHPRHSREHSESGVTIEGEYTVMDDKKNNRE